MFIKNKKIYAANGDLLKEIHCPKKVSIDELTRNNRVSFNCNLCEKEVLDTDHLSGQELEKILRDNPETCLKINLFNPMFNPYV